MILPTPLPGEEVRWVEHHLGDLCRGPVRAAPHHRGTQAAADRALARLDLRGYATGRNQVWPTTDRRGSGLSPWIRHGLLHLAQVATAAHDAPGSRADREKFSDELYWQEYARHLYARLGGAMAHPVRHSPATVANAPPGTPAQIWDRSMACVDLAIGELVDTGVMVNQTRMWMASHWTVRHGGDWREGEQAFFRSLLDGSRAANRLGWQWTIGAGTGRPYGFARSQVERRAPGICTSCPHRTACPIEHWPDPQSGMAVPDDPRLRRDPDPDATAGPRAVATTDATGFAEADSRDAGRIDAVWITAESLGDDDPALGAHLDLPVMFVFDEALLRRVDLAPHRVVFLAERLAELARQRQLLIHRGDPAETLRGHRLAATFAPVPGWRRIAAQVTVAEVHPWPWLRRPRGENLRSYSAWRRAGR